MITMKTIEHYHQYAILAGLIFLLCLVLVTGQYITLSLVAVLLVLGITVLRDANRPSREKFIVYVLGQVSFLILVIH